MKRPCLSGLSNPVLLNEFSARLARHNTDTAELLLYLAEIDRRKLYLPAGYRSMYAYCVGHFHFSEAAAYKRIHAARLIRRFPAVFPAIAEGRVHLSGLVLLVAHLTTENVEELLAAAMHRSRAQIEHMLAERFPKPDVPAVLLELPSAAVPASAELSPGRVSDVSLTPLVSATEEPPALRANDPDPPACFATAGPTVTSTPDLGRVRPLSAKTYAVQFTMGQHTHELLRRAQDLLGHRVAPGDLATVFHQALEAYVERLERARFSATERPNAHPRPARTGTRYIQARLKRAVWERDGGQCTFVSESGQRCEARKDLEFDHVKEYARGGEATPDNIRLRCPGHNQHTAEQTYGAGFMQRKREERRAAARRRRKRGVA